MRHWQESRQLDAVNAQWADKHILFVSGKGGVGKSLVAAAIADQHTRAGRRVLLAELGDTSYYKDYWNLPAVGHEPIRTRHGFDLALWSGESCLREYVLYYLRMERLYKLFFENKVMRALVNVAPGLNEIAVLGKITSGLRRVGPALTYDLIVVDCYSTGHAMALLSAPRGMMEAVKFGPMGTHSRDMDTIIRDTKVCGFLLVTLLEEMAVTETLEFSAKLKAEIQQSAEIIANRVLTVPILECDLESVAKVEPRGLGEFAQYLLGASKRQKKFLNELRETGCSVHLVPQIFSADPDELVRVAGEALRKA